VTLLQSVLSGGDERPALSVVERLHATNEGLRHSTGTTDGMWLVVGSIAALLLVAAAIAWVVRHAKRARWASIHTAKLSDLGLHDEELHLFRQLALESDAGRVPLLARQRAAFDLACADLVQRQHGAAARRLELSRLLALRRRIPFDARLKGPPELAPGRAVTLCLRVRRGDARQLSAVVLATHPHALQLALDDEPESQLVVRNARIGQEFVLVVRGPASVEEARVRLRGRRGRQLLVDRPIATTPSRVRIAWHGAHEDVHVEMVERFSERLVGDEVPTTDATVVATCSEGIVVRFASVRPRHGEAIRLVDGARPGFYRGYAVLDPKGRGGEVFVVRRTSDRHEAPPEIVQPGEERHEPGVRARPGVLVDST
jgi:uncharacterized membrane protein